MQNVSISKNFLKCTKCSKPPLPWTDPLECISCGFIYCNSCIKSNIGFSCFKCLQKSMKTSKLSKRILGNQKVNCTYCGQSELYKNLGDHSKKCQNWVFSCTTKNCNFTGKQNDFIRHVQADHESDLVSYFHRDSNYNQRKNRKRTVNTNLSSSNIYDSKISTSKSADKKDCYIF